MLSRLRAAAVLVALLAASLQPAQADPADVTAGMLRAPVNKSGAMLRAEPKVGAEILGNIPHGARLAVQAVNGAWIQVTTEVTLAGAKASKTGWLKSNETVQPFALTGAGREGAVGTASAATGSRATAAAGRGFGPDSEQALAQSDAKIGANYVNVDRIEEAKPSPAEVVTFAKEGRLGFPGRTR